MIAMRDKLIDLITVGIVRYSVQQAAGNNPDMAAIIADVLMEKWSPQCSDIRCKRFAVLKGNTRRGKE